MNKKAQRLIFTVLLGFLLSSMGWTQSVLEQCMNFYRQQDFDKIQLALKNVAPQDTNRLEYLFFKSIFLRDAELAQKNYETVYARAQGALKKMAAERLYDYYYARALYVKANQFKNQTAEILPGKTATTDITQSQEKHEALFKIQVGAFSKRQNALAQLNKLESQKVKAQIVKRRINEKDFYCVWVKGLSTIEETRKLAEQLKKKFNFNYRIIKP